MGKEGIETREEVLLPSRTQTLIKRLKQEHLPFDERSVYYAGDVHLTLMAGVSDAYHIFVSPKTPVFGIPEEELIEEPAQIPNSGSFKELGDQLSQELVQELDDFADTVVSTIGMTPRELKPAFLDEERGRVQVPLLSYYFQLFQDEISPLPNETPGPSRMRKGREEGEEKGDPERSIKILVFPDPIIAIVAHRYLEGAIKDNLPVHGELGRLSKGFITQNELKLRGNFADHFLNMLQKHVNEWEKEKEEAKIEML